MPAGLQVNNSSGYPQIDEEYIGYREIQSGTAGGTVSDSVMITYPAQPEPALIVIKPNGTAKSYVVRQVFTNAVEMYIRPIVNTTETHYFDYKVLVPLKNTTPSGITAGLQVFNSSGILAFDSGYSVFRIQAAFVVNPDGSTVNFAVPADANPYWFTLNSTRTFSNSYDSSISAWREKGLAIGQNSSTQFRMELQNTVAFPDVFGTKGTAWTSSGLPLTAMFGTFS